MSILDQYSRIYTYAGYNGVFVYTGRRAQVLNYLKDAFAIDWTTYLTHAGGPTMSADGWTPGARYGVDNSNMPGMNAAAEYIAANLAPLGIKHIIWKQRINMGAGWRPMGYIAENPTVKNHFDHFHIMFGRTQIGDPTVPASGGGSRQGWTTPDERTYTYDQDLIGIAQRVHVAETIRRETPPNKVINSSYFGEIEIPGSGEIERLARNTRALIVRALIILLGLYLVQQAIRKV